MVSVVVRNQKESRRIYLEVIEGDQERLRRKEDEMMRRHGRPRKRRPGRDLKEQQMRRNDCSSCILQTFMLQETLLW